MQLGAFSISLTVADLEASRTFYEALGFVVIAGGLSERMVMMRNDTTTIGLFQGMFPKNMLTFNPGWSASAEPLERFQDVRELQALLEARGLTLSVRADEASAGPAHLVLIDPDGNPILLDQHVPRPSL
jgi:catechol 2,3-dioxygenase-like lactoylglutathione lyase family enzyme